MDFEMAKLINDCDLSSGKIRDGVFSTVAMETFRTAVWN